MTKNLHLVIWFQVFLSHNYHLYAIIWFEVSISHTNNFQTDLFHPYMRPNRYYHSRSVDLGVMATKGYSTFPIALELEYFYQMQFSIILQSLFSAEILSLCKGCRWHILSFFWEGGELIGKTDYQIQMTCSKINRYSFMKLQMICIKNVHFFSIGYFTNTRIIKLINYCPKCVLVFYWGWKW